MRRSRILRSVEHEFPLAPADLARLTPDNLKAYDQEQIDQLYARLSAGPIPDGPYDGGLFFPKGISGEKRIAEIIGGLPGLAAQVKTEKLELVGKHLWRGKVFYRDERVLRNRIEDTALLKPLIDGDLSTIPKIAVNGKEQWLMFPARLYCGQSLLDSRRESVIIDYFYTDEIPGYRERPDYLAGRRGLQVRDEVRMVRPGFYLGRAYLGKIFLLNFTLLQQGDRGPRRRCLREDRARQGRMLAGNAAASGLQRGKVTFAGTRDDEAVRCGDRRGLRDASGDGRLPRGARVGGRPGRARHIVASGWTFAVRLRGRGRRSISLRGAGAQGGDGCGLCAGGMRQARADPPRPLAPAHRRRPGFLRVSSRRRRGHRRGRGAGVRARSPLPRLPGEGESRRGHQL